MNGHAYLRKFFGFGTGSCCPIDCRRVFGRTRGRSLAITLNSFAIVLAWGHGAWLTPVVTRDSAFSGYGPRVAMFCKACEMILSRAGDIQRSDDRSWTMLEDAGMAHDTRLRCDDGNGDDAITSKSPALASSSCQPLERDDGIGGAACLNSAPAI